MNAFVLLLPVCSPRWPGSHCLLAPAAPAHAIQGRYFTQEYNGSGHVDIDDINMSNGVLSFTVIIEGDARRSGQSTLLLVGKADDGTKYRLARLFGDHTGLG